MTEQVATKIKTKRQQPKGPAPYRHEDLILVRATLSEIVQRTWTNNMDQWAKGVPLPQYHAREKYLASTAFSSDNRLITWVLVPKPDADVTMEYRQSTTTTDSNATNAVVGNAVRGGFDEKDGKDDNLERIMSAVETYERPGMVARVGENGEEEEVLEEVSSVSVASVYAPSKYRNHGYGKLMMKLLWEEIEKMGVSFTFLYSDLGPQFYTNFGWTARTSTEIVIPPSMLLPSAPIATESGDAEDSQKRTTRALASANSVSLEAVVGDESLKTLVDRDAQLLRETLKQRVHEQKLEDAVSATTTTTTFVAVTPEIRCFQWFYARAWYNATEIWKFNQSQIQDGLHYGIRVQGTHDQFALWHHDFTDDNLYILRWRIDSTNSKEEADRIALAFVEAAQKEAKKWNLSKIVYWNADTALAKLLGLEVKHRDHSIPSLGMVNSLRDPQNMKWVLNEKYSW
ncbi:hypothetical protein BGZ58_006026 [Dissophora ornata]|nr:hypothetical protein BGZ58_006026 [Dissophora ornata]